VGLRYHSLTAGPAMIIANIEDYRKQRESKLPASCSTTSAAVLSMRTRFARILPRYRPRCCQRVLSRKCVVIARLNLRDLVASQFGEFFLSGALRQGPFVLAEKPK
jgi:hypothetical protein